MFQYQEWPEHGVPSNCNDVLNLLTAVEKEQHKHGNAPVLVMCR